ncbi:MAG TPA: hypothetical protein PLM92_05510, partial [Bacillota bacterium]|nr:hypothetical protein [Bacillota bacterium]
EKGYDAVVYGIPVCEIFDEMIYHMSINLSREEKHYTDIMSDMIRRRENPAMMMKKDHKKGDRHV